jgi:hypothetical protein
MTPASTDAGLCTVCGYTHAPHLAPNSGVNAHGRPPTVDEIRAAVRALGGGERLPVGDEPDATVGGGPGPLIGWPSPSDVLVARLRREVVDLQRANKELEVERDSLLFGDVGQLRREAVQLKRELDQARAAADELYKLDRSIEERLAREKAELEGKLRNSEASRRNLAATCTRRTEELSRVQDELVAAKTRIRQIEAKPGVVERMVEIARREERGQLAHESGVAKLPEYHHPRRGVVVACQGEEDGDL